jgi:DNA-binding beta-propeller fold protein YncE
MGSKAMNRPQFLVLLVPLAAAGMLYGQTRAPLRLEKIIPMPDVQGRIDHMSFDAGTGRLFVSALGNDTLEVIDTKQGRRIHSIRGLREPQGVIYLPGPNRIFVANGGDGTVRIFDGSSYGLIRTTNLGDDADNIRWDSKAKRIYVGFGSGVLATLDESGNKVSDIKLGAHPESFRLETDGPKIFVNLPELRKIAVIDRNEASVIGRWSTDAAYENFPMALDEPDHRLFVVCRRPPVLMVVNTASGEIISKLPAVGDSDDVFYDAASKRIYASGGQGELSVFQQDDANHYRQIANMRTRKGARTSFFSPDSRCLYVAARRQGNDPAAIYAYRLQR